MASPVDTKELPKARKRRLLSQLGKVMLAGLSTCMIGTLFTYPSAMFSDLVQHNTTIYGSYISMEGKEDLVGSLLMLGSLPGAWLIGLLSVKMGRKKSLILSAVVGVLGWLGVALIPYAEGILTSRFISGMALGGLSISVNAYAAELADPEVRGMMLMTLNINIMIGQLLTVVLGYITRYYIVAFTNSLIPAGLLISLIWLPESPSVLVLKGKDEEAKEILYTLRGKHANVQEEIDQYKAMNEEIRRGPAWRGLLTRDSIKSLLIISCLFMLTVFSGYIVINANASRLFEDAGTTVDGSMAAIIIMVVQLVASLAGSLLMDKIGRRNILFTGLFLMTSSLACLAGYAAVMQGVSSSSDTGNPAGTSNMTEYLGFLQDPIEIVYPDSNTGGWIPLACLVVSQTGVALGVGTMPFMLSQEYFPTAVRAQATSICFTVYTVSTFSVLQLYTPMVDGLTNVGLYAFYATVSLITIPFTIFFVRETMGEQVG